MPLPQTPAAQRRVCSLMRRLQAELLTSCKMVARERRRRRRQFAASTATTTNLLKAPASSAYLTVNINNCHNDSRRRKHIQPEHNSTEATTTAKRNRLTTMTMRRRAPAAWSSSLSLPLAALVLSVLIILIPFPSIDSQFLDAAMKTQQQPQLKTQVNSQQQQRENVIQSTAFDMATHNQQQQQPPPPPLQSEPRFKYHLSHLQPPSLVPITIRQAATTTPSPLLSSHRTKRQQEDDAAVSSADSQLATRVGGGLGERQHQGTAAAFAGAGDRLFQLQLPLQLHLKLKPLPLPMPPPTDRLEQQHSTLTTTMTPDGDVAAGQAAGKRAIGHEQQQASELVATQSPILKATVLASTLFTEPSNGDSNQKGSNRPVRTTTTTEVEAANDEACDKEQRANLLPFTKRILLLSSMAAPVLAAHQHQQQQWMSVGANPGEPSEVFRSNDYWQQQQQARRANNKQSVDVGEPAAESWRSLPVAATTASSSSGQKSGLATRPLILEQPEAAATRQQQPESTTLMAAGATTATTLIRTKKQSAQLPERRPKQPAGAASEESPNLAWMLVGKKESPTTATTTTMKTTLTAGSRQGAGSETTTTAVTTNSSGGTSSVSNNEQQTDKESSAAAAGEVRHQRHSSQQQQLHQLVINRIEPAELAADGRIQAMAAAMLPLFWPSFQLASSAQQHKSKSPQIGARPKQLQPEVNAADGWPVRYTQLSRQLPRQNLTMISSGGGDPAAFAKNSLTAVLDVASTGLSAETHKLAGGSLEAARAPMPTTTQMPATSVASDDNDGNRRQKLAASTTTTSERPARRRRRKPTYLQQKQQTASTSSVTPAYADSTRLASRYPMPKIKFQARNTDASLANRKALERSQQQHQQPPRRKPTDKGEAANANLLSSLAPPKWKSPNKQVHLPKSLSELIEQQVRLNATNLLLQHKATPVHANPSSSSSSFALIGSVGRIKSNKAPTTSVSKVVRLLTQNTTAADLQFLTSQGVGAVREFYNDFKRHRAASSASSPSSAANPSSTPPPATTSTSPLALTTTETSPPGTTSPAPPTTTTQSAANTTTTGQPRAAATTLRVGQERETLRAPSRAETTVSDNVVTISVVSSVDSTGGNSEQPTQAITTTSMTTTVRPQEATPVSNLSASLQQLATALDLQTAQQDDNTVGVGNNKKETAALQPTTTTTTAATTAASAATASAKPKKLFSAGSPRFKGGTATTGAHGGRPGRLAANNIKLFHFKRKPDMAKLPFYKKPLNYTELGWTSEQIQEHLEYSGLQLDGSIVAAAAAGSQANSGGGNIDERDAALLKRKRRGGKSNQFERLMAELHGQQQQSQQQAAALARSELDQAKEQQTSGDGSSSEQAGAAGDAGEERVPVIRKKVEPLLMKPMFSVMNQRRRVATNGGTSQSGVSEQLATSPTTSESGALAQSPSQAVPSNRSKPIIRMRRKHHGELPLLQFRRSDFVMNGAGGPANEQPTIGSNSNGGGGIHQPATIWPTTTLQQPPDHSSSSSNSRRQQLLLVPSGLLTPSGSQLVPLYSPSAQVKSQRRLALAEFGGVSLDEQSRLVDELFAWRPARQPQLQLQLAGAHWQPASSIGEEGGAAMKPRGGLAPSGEESFLLAPSQSVAAAQPNAERLVLVASSGQLPMAAVAMEQQRPMLSPMAVPTNQPQPQQSVTVGELRVPKLLVKPMRPAKYSLNGYIPKPSLPQQQQPPQGFPASAANSGQPANSMQTGGGQLSGRAKLQRTNLSQPASHSQHPHHFGVPHGPHLQTGRDLESSTSNEIFSRRRGLQQHQRNSANGLNSGGQWLFSSFVAGNQTSGSERQRPDGEQPQAHRQMQRLSAVQRQMEENKRKYIAQQQQFALNKSPTLSVQKANLIKAKLGLIVTATHTNRDATTASTSGNGKSDFNNTHQNASTNDVLTSDPAALLDRSGPRILMSAKGADTASNIPFDAPALVGAPLNSIPKTDFECTDSKGKFMAGLFADRKTGCQVWHLCANNRKYSFLCPAGTIFNAKLRICDWTYNVKCA